MSENDKSDKVIQKLLNKLISDEWVAGNLYYQMRLACHEDDRAVVDELFSVISQDEITDHMHELVRWAFDHKFDVPSKTSEFMKYAGKADVKQFEHFKTKQKADYYLNEAIKSEKSAIESYKVALEADELIEYTDLQALLWHIYYDEEEHLRNLNSALIAYQAQTTLCIC